MTIAFASGKGGTGKTSLAVNFAMFLSEKLSNKASVALYDLDVEEPDTQIFFPLQSREDVSCREAQLEMPLIDLHKCSFCGLCAERCNFNAISVTSKSIQLFNELCKSCKKCHFICPQNAVNFTKVSIGKILSFHYASLNVTEGTLNVGDVHSKNLIAETKKHSTANIIIYDCPPGTTCPMVESLIDADFVVLVTEPTPFGLHDLSLACEVMNKLGKAFGVVLNKAGTNDAIIVDFCKTKNIQLLGKIPFHVALVQKCGNGEFYYHEDVFQEKMNKIFNKIQGALAW